MNEDDFLLDEEDEDLDENYVTPEDEDEDSLIEEQREDHWDLAIGPFVVYN